MKNLISFLTALLATAGAVHAQRGWDFPDGEAGLKRAFHESDDVALVCVVDVRLEKVDRPGWVGIFDATVTSVHKGRLQVAEKIKLHFPAENVPEEGKKREESIEEAKRVLKGQLSYAFLKGKEGGAYLCEVTQMPVYHSDLSAFLKALEETKAEDAKPGEEGKSAVDKFGPFEGDLAFDPASDERDATVSGIVKRNDEYTSGENFSSIDVPSVRANVVMLTTLISTYGGGFERKSFERWEKAVIATFEDPEKWGFQPWPEEEKKEWRRACKADLGALRRLMADQWEE